MTAVRPRRPPARRPPPHRELLRLGAVVAGALLLFLVGMAVGRATDAGPPQGTRTLERTLRVDTVTPAVQTVTVTVESGG